MKLIHRVRILLIGVLSCAAVMGVSYGGLYGWIQWDAQQKAQAVWTDYPQAEGPVESLILRMRDIGCPMKDRNMAVWTLGRLAHEQALPALEREYTGQPCEHDKHLCQYELEKAILRCGG
jgi:hypothetical protein